MKIDTNYTLADVARTFCFRRRIAGKVAELHRRHIDMNIYSIQ